MLIGVIADDFTGASDIANTLAKGTAPDGGLKTAQFAQVPDGPAPSDIDAGVVSLKSRTAPTEQAVSDSIAALKWLQAQGCKQIIFKYCSTFDSTKNGNIGPVAEALANEISSEQVIFCPAFPATGRTVYQGHLFVGDRLLNESGMEKHPLTPMTDANIPRWLAHQTAETVSHVALKYVRQGAAAIRRALSTTDGRFVVTDAVNDSDLLELGLALSDAPLVTGGSGVAMGLPRNFIRSGKAASHTAQPIAVDGPEAVLAGSCSGATRRQVEVHAANHPVLPIDVAGVMEGRVAPKRVVDFYQANVGKAPLAYSSGTPDHVHALQRRFGRENIADRLDSFFAEIATMLVQQGYTRIVVAGGETSGAVAQAVSCEANAPAMTIGPEIDPGVPVLTLGEAPTVALALKSGNFGAEDFFAKALQVMAGAP